MIPGETRETIRRLWPLVRATAIAFRVNLTANAVRRLAAEMGLGPNPFTTGKPTRAERN